MERNLRHRGPDSGGLHEAPGVGLAVRRLKVIDLLTGDQPITSKCTGNTIVYNGELYNYRELRERLWQRGHQFTTSSDTEVVLHLVEEFGIDGLAKLNGMFAFAIYEPSRQRLVLARDHLGIKPLYYAALGNHLFFASEIKALVNSGAVGGGLDRRGLANYLLAGHSIGEQTAFPGIKRLMPGHAAIYEHGAFTTTEYWSVPRNAHRIHEADAGKFIGQLQEHLVSSVRRNLLADVPIGVFLSGGLDSSIVAALMAKDSERVRSYSVGYGGPHDELAAAAATARHIGSEHSELVVTSEDAAGVLPVLSGVYDEPFADAAAVPTYLLAKRARQEVTVVLTGEGGDELFGGYRRYVADQFHNAYRRFPSRARALLGRIPLEHLPRTRRFGRALRVLAIDDDARRYEAWTELFNPQERGALLGEDLSEAHVAYERLIPSGTDGLTRHVTVELQGWLPDAYLEKVDKATMASSLEARVPLLDRELVEFFALAPKLWKVARGQTKVALREAAHAWLPESVTRRPKRGFSPPTDLWLRTTLRDEVRALAGGGSAIEHLLEASAIRRIAMSFEAGAWRPDQIWALLVLEHWWRAVDFSSDSRPAECCG